ncbi:PJA2 ligase, partial [Anhinga anhinga]|nr:PJA2 ligase [Anhinga anhinga]
MRQEAGKSAWPKPEEGYQTATGRRYGRRHDSDSFRPDLNGPDRGEGQCNEDCEPLESQRENSSCMYISFTLGQVSSGLPDKPSLENTGTGEPTFRSVSSQTCELNISPFAILSYDLEILENFINPYKNSEEYASGGHKDLNGQKGIAFVNIDSYEPDSSDGEESNAQEKFYLAREEVAFRESLDNIFSEVEKGTGTFTDLRPPLSTLNHSVSRERCEEAGPMPLVRYFSIDSDLACPNNRTLEFSAEDQAILKSNLSGNNCETQQINTVDAGIGTPLAIANELNVNSYTTDQGNLPELVVRPKIRKQSTANELERENYVPSDDEKEGASWWGSEIAEVQQRCAEYVWRKSEGEMSFSMFFDLRDYELHQKNTEVDLRKNAAAQDQKDVLDDGTSWNKLEDCSRHLSVFHRLEHCLESDEEWTKAKLAFFSGMDKDKSSSDEVWETVQCGEEDWFELERAKSDTEEQNMSFSFPGREQTLEEGEVPWLRYREEVESSSDEEDRVSDFFNSGFLLFHGNNNPEDDSSVSEDLDVEWSLLDEFGGGLGLAQAIPFVVPEYATFMTVEGHLQQAVEAVLAHLESLGFDAEQAYPPATKETIDGLPQIIITDDQDGVCQEQCCTICWSEYVKDEILTELPCHHLFHKACVTLWLQRSGTCPVCRHVLAPVVSEAAAATVSVLSDHDSTSPV